MMYDRPYMTDTHQANAKKTLVWLIGATVVIWVLQMAVDAISGRDYLQEFFGFAHDSLPKGFIWTPITYAFLHAISSPFHLLGNMLGVFFLGRALLPVLGQKRFLQLYLGSAIVGGMIWYATSFLTGTNAVIGASAAVLGLLTFFGCLYPNQDIQILLFFILPVQIKPKYLVWISLFVASVGFIFYELARRPDGYAHSAHLGGMLGGYLFYRFIYAPNPYPAATSSGFGIKLPKLFGKKSPKSRNDSYRYSVNISSKPQDMKQEVDRILDKINSKGFGSLTPAEKQTLDEARDLLRRR